MPSRSGVGTVMTAMSKRSMPVEGRRRPGSGPVARAAATSASVMSSTNDVPGGQRLAAVLVDVVADHVVAGLHGPHGQRQPHVALPDDDHGLGAHAPIMTAGTIREARTPVS